MSTRHTGTHPLAEKTCDDPKCWCHEPEQFPAKFRYTWFRLYRAVLAGICAAHERGKMWNEDEIADDAASIADSALAQYRKRFP